MKIERSEIYGDYVAVLWNKNKDKVYCVHGKTFSAAINNLLYVLTMNKKVSRKKRCFYLSNGKLVV